MPETPEDARLESHIPAEQIAHLAVLYDKFAHALDPFSEERDEAERIFLEEVASWYDTLNPPKPKLHEFRKGIIIRCKRHLKASSKLSGI